jgi:hypothetical protein
MSMNPILAEMMAQTRRDDMRRAAAPPSGGWRRRSIRHAAVEARALQASSGSAFPSDTPDVRRAIGWFLVSAGLRLAVPRPRSVSAR